MQRVPRLAVDAVLIHREKLVLVKRGTPPFLGMYALPGGALEFGEALEEGVEREVLEETGLDAEVERLLGVYGDPDRDPRGHTISVAYVLRSVGGTLKAGTDAAATKLVPVSARPVLAFDHARILADFRRTLTGPRRAASTVPSRAPAPSRSGLGGRKSTRTTSNRRVPPRRPPRTRRAPPRSRSG